MGKTVDILRGCSSSDKRKLASLQEESSDKASKHVSKKNKVSKKKKKKEEETEDEWVLYPRLCASLQSEAPGRVRDMKEHVKEMISGMGEVQAKELEQGWDAIHVLDVQLFAKRAQLIAKQSEAALATLIVQGGGINAEQVNEG